MNYDWSYILYCPWICTCVEFTARVFPIYPEQGQWKMTLSSCTFGGRNCKQKTSPAFFIGVWCQFRECSVTAWQRMCKHLLFCLEYCQHQANQNSDLLLNCPKCLFCLHFQTHTKPTRRTKSHSPTTCMMTLQQPEEKAAQGGCRGLAPGTSS